MLYSSQTSAVSGSLEKLSDLPQGFHPKSPRVGFEAISWPGQAIHFIGLQAIFQGEITDTTLPHFHQHFRYVMGCDPVS